MISKNTIDKIFSTIRVEEIVGEYVQLKRSGSNLKGLSPFVDEKSPSFMVSPSKQIWKDFSSGKGGTAISFLMEIEQFSYPEALRYAAKKYSIEIEEDKIELTDQRKEELKNRDLLYKIHEVAQSFFEEQLWNTEEGKLIGFSYLKERKLSNETIKKFKLGYSPEQKNAFTSYALGKAYQKEWLESSGLSIFPENQPSGIDRFRERIIFPIHSFSGRVLGFGARLLKNNIKTAKYLNSPETEIYHKSSIVYGIHQSKQAISKENECFLVEGYMDVISMHQAGLENVVASSGTSLTVDQIKLIKRLTTNVNILFDGDAAGIKASFRSIDLLLEQDMNIKVLLFPEGHDPDSFVQNYPLEFVKKFIKENSKDFILFKAEILFKDVAEDPMKRAEAIKNIVQSIAHIKDNLKREVYLQETSKLLQIPEKIMFSELELQQNLLQNQNKNKKPSLSSAQNSAPILEVVKKNEIEELDPVVSLEERLMDLMIKFGNYIIDVEIDDKNSYQTTVIQEVITRTEQDDYPWQLEIHQEMVKDIKEGLERNELRVGDFFFSKDMPELQLKLASSLIEHHFMSNWGKHNIYYHTEEELLSAGVHQCLLRHKRAYVLKLIQELKNDIIEQSKLNSDFDSHQILERIIKLNGLKSKIDTKLNRVL